MLAMKLTALVTIGAVFTSAILGGIAGSMRDKHGVIVTSLSTGVLAISACVGAVNVFYQ